MHYTESPEPMTENEKKAMALLRCDAITAPWVPAECGTCGKPCTWPDPAIAQMIYPSTEGAQPLAPMCNRCMYADSEHEAQRLRWQVDQRRIQQATEAMAAIQDRPLNPVLRRWIETDRKALVLYGPSGYGKTTQIKALMTAYVRHHHQSVVYYTEAGAYNALTQFEHKEEVAKVRARIQSASLLVIDDYGTAAASDYRSELLYELVDHVYRTGRRIIVATNLDEEKMWGRADDRVNRRLRDMCGKALAMPTIWAGVARAERPARAMDDNG